MFQYVFILLFLFSVQIYAKDIKNIEKLCNEENNSTLLIEHCTNLAKIYEGNYDYQNAIKYYKKSLATIESPLQKENRAIDIVKARGYMHIATLFKQMGEYHNSLKYVQKTLALRERALGKENIETAQSYNNVAMLYGRLGEYLKAIKFYKKSIIIYENKLGKNHKGTATNYNNIAGIYRKMGKYKNALYYYEKSMFMREKFFGKEHKATATSYNNISLLYQDIADDVKALNYAKKTLKIIEKKLGKNHKFTATIYANIGLLYKRMGDHPKALIYNKKSLLIKEKILGKDHIDTALSYNNMAGLYVNMKLYFKALPYLRKSLIIYKKNLGEKHIDIAVQYSNIGRVLIGMKKYKKALALYEKSLKIREETLGKNHQNTIGIYSNIGVLYYGQKEYVKAYKFLKISFQLFIKNRDKTFVILNSQQKGKYLKLYNRINTFFLVSNLYLSKLKKENKVTKEKEVLSSTINNWLKYKGSIFNSESFYLSLHAEAKDKKVKKIIEELNSAKLKLAKTYQTYPDANKTKEWQEEIAKISQNIRDIEQSLAKKVTKVKEELGLRDINYQDIAKILKDNEIYIDYARTTSNYYVFTVDSSENINFISIDENSSKEIDAYVQEFKTDINLISKDTNLSTQKNLHSRKILTKLYEKVIKKPLKNILKEKTSLIISSDGALRAIPFESMYDGQEQKYLIEQKNIRYISSGRELVRLFRYSTEYKSENRVVIFSNPNFDANISDTRASRRLERNDISELFSMKFGALKGTVEEAKRIKKILKNADEIDSYAGTDANESVLLELKSPKILHLATHGFFINDDRIPNPMLKSGIVLSGANYNAFHNDKDYGIVTALKLSGLNLKGTDLVVLSACSTGVIDLNSTENISGLSKAFIQAGAKNVIMSLWEVDDMKTMEFMSSFYQESQKNNNYAKALRASKLKMIEENLHPYFWSAFILNGI